MTADGPVGDHDRLLFLRAARESGVLEAVLERAGTPGEVAAQAGVTERAARIALEALAEEGLLTVVDGEYEPTNRALGFLTKRDLRSIGRLPAELDAVDAWTALPETMRGADPPEADLANRLGAAAATDDSTVRAVATAAERAHPGAERAIDLHGGPGNVATELAARGLDVALFDEPAVVERVGPLLAHRPVELVDDPDDLPAADLVVAVEVTSRRGPEGNRRLLDLAADALAPGGTAVVVDYLRGRTPNAALLAARRFAAGAGDVYAEERYAEWFEAAGFDRPAAAGVPGTPYAALTAGRAID